MEDPLSADDVRELLQVARRAIEIPHFRVLPQRKNRGVFVALWMGEKLSGCFGFPEPDPNKSLEESIQEAAIAAASDSRFPPLSSEHLLHMEIELSLLTPPQPIELHQIQLGIHGLIIAQEEKTGLLLPQAPIKYGWNLETFLEKLCIKADLPQNAWEKGAQLSAFETQVFRESSLLSS